MSALARTLRAYPTLLRIGVAEMVAYRAELVIWMLTMTMPLVMMAIMTAMAREGDVGRFDGEAFVAYYLGTLIVRQTTGAWVVWEMVREIREGTLALRLLRPIHPMVSYSAESMAALPLRALIALPVAVLLLALRAGARVTHDPVVLGCFVLSLLGAWLLNFSVSALVGTLGLYIESSLKVWELWLGGFMLLSGYLIPLSLFPGWLERVARASPFAYLQAVPVEMLVGLRDREAALRGLLGQWAWAVGALLLLFLVFRRAVRHFAAFGG